MFVKFGYQKFSLIFWLKISELKMGQLDCTQIIPEELFAPLYKFKEIINNPAWWRNFQAIPIEGHFGELG